MRHPQHGQDRTQLAVDYLLLGLCFWELVYCVWAARAVNHFAGRPRGREPAAGQFLLGICGLLDRNQSMGESEMVRLRTDFFLAFSNRKQPS